jgi:hypothetical protein
VVHAMGLLSIFAHQCTPFFASCTPMHTILVLLHTKCTASGLFCTSNLHTKCTAFWPSLTPNRGNHDRAKRRTSDVAKSLLALRVGGDGLERAPAAGHSWLWEGYLASGEITLLTSQTGEEPSSSLRAARPRCVC